MILLLKTSALKVTQNNAQYPNTTFSFYSGSDIEQEKSNIAHQVQFPSLFIWDRSRKITM